MGKIWKGAIESIRHFKWALGGVLKGLGVTRFGKEKAEGWLPYSPYAERSHCEVKMDTSLSIPRNFRCQEIGLKEAEALSELPRQLNKYATKDMGTGGIDLQIRASATTWLVPYLPSIPCGTCNSFASESTC